MLLYANTKLRKATKLAVRTITADAHLAYVRSEANADTVSFLQCPSWGAVKSEWCSESVGWFHGSEVVGAGTVLYRALPRLGRVLAYLPEGPMIDWHGERTPHQLADWLDPLLAHLRARRAFSVKMGPKVLARSWSAATVKRAMADEALSRLGEVTPDDLDTRADDLVRRLRELGWRREHRDGPGFGDAQPRCFFRLPLAGRDEAWIWGALSQQWRRNIRIAERGGVEVHRGAMGDLPEFHRIYSATAARDGFIPRQLSYFQGMFQAFDAEDADRVRLYLARRQGELLAAATMVRVGRHAWYGYGASADHGREFRPSNAVQWRMIQDCLADGMAVYDLRGISDTLDPENHLFGLLQFKVGTGGEAVEYLGEWDFPINRLLHRAFQLYLTRR
jgi:lipid II:glycine glycyltransferase (peptidoglycan interpeptide bridge formation enzyme)